MKSQESGCHDGYVISQNRAQGAVKKRPGRKDDSAITLSREVPAVFSHLLKTEKNKRMFPASGPQTSSEHFHSNGKTTANGVMW